MAFRVIKQRREARRNAKLEEIFLERDKLQDETISCQDMQDVFRMYGVRHILDTCLWNTNRVFKIDPIKTKPFCQFFGVFSPFLPKSQKLDLEEVLYPNQFPNFPVQFSFHINERCHQDKVIQLQLELSKQQVNKIKNEKGFIEKADFIKCAQVRVY